MIDEKYIVKLIDECLLETDRFLVSVSVSSSNQINVAIDGDTGVTIDHCVEVSRYIENRLDREVEDFELKVATAGIEEPFVNQRQYKKNIGKAVEIQLEDDSIKRGVLNEVSDEAVLLAEEIVRKHKKSKKMDVGDPIRIDMKDIRQTKGIVIF